MKSIQLINPSGRKVFVADNRVHHLLEQGFQIAPQQAPVKVAAPPAEPEQPADDEDKDLDEMDRDELAAEAEARGLDFHPRLGAAKLRALLSE